MGSLQDQKNKKADMGYLVDFEKAIENHDAPSILRLWEEYTSSDEVDGEDFRAILEAVKKSDLHEYIGRHVERSLPIWEKVKSPDLSDDILRLIIDLQMMNNDLLRQITMAHIEKRFGSDQLFGEKMRLIGLRGEKGDFKGAISHFILLNHMQKGNFVFHNAGWGVGEIIEISMLREQLSLEFDYAPGRKDMSFKVAFTTLVPIPKTHFLAERFGNPDALEVKAKENPVELIRKLLKDLGPKTAAEIKDELCELVIPEKEWNRWWQTTRTKLKKDTHIESPQDLKHPFRLLKEEISHEERLQADLDKKPDADTLIQMVYSFLKDFSETLKNIGFKDSLIAKMKELISFKEITAAQELQVHYFLQDLSGEKEYQAVPDILKKAESIEKLVEQIPIQSFKKRTLLQVHKYRPDWQEIFLNLLFKVEQSALRDYLLTELLKSEKSKELKTRLDSLCLNPQLYPELIIWYFQKCLVEPELPHGSLEGRARVFEAFLIALGYLEQKGEKREIIKKMHNILSSERYAIVREIMKDATLIDVQEFLLLITKCHSLSDHDIKLFYSLAEVAHPSLAKKRKKPKTPENEEEVIWTTREGYLILQKKIEQIGTVETVENAKDIEIARAHGDLRENAEFKAALERRDRLQSELKFLSDQLNKSRILSQDDFDTKKIGVGAIVTCENEDDKTITYTILGPWDADPDKNILSFQSKLARSMIDLQKGDVFEFQGKKHTIVNFTSAI